MIQSLAKVIFIGMVIGAITALMALMPDAQPLPSAVGDGIEIFFDYLWRMNFILPVPTLLTVSVIAFGVQGAIAFVHFMKWVLGLMANLFA